MKNIEIVEKHQTEKERQKVTLPLVLYSITAILVGLFWCLPPPDPYVQD